jgi:hypothetical protein
MCQMLNAGGMKVFHDEGMGYPSFETRLQFLAADDPSWLNAIDGGAVKWLEPQRSMPARGTKPLQILWMTRDHWQQARSAVKFLSQVGGYTIPTRAAHAMAASYGTDEPPARRGWEARGPVLIVQFETLLSEPERTAERVAEFLGADLDTKAMVEQVRPRGPECLPGFLELQLIAEHDASAAR